MLLRLYVTNVWYIFTGTGVSEKSSATFDVLQISEGLYLSVF